LSCKKHNRIFKDKKIEFNQNQALKDLELHESFLKSIIKPLSLLSFLSALVGIGNVLFPEIKYEILKFFQENSCNQKLMLRLVYQHLMLH